MVFGAKLRTIMSSIIRWRKVETLRAVAMDCLNGVLLLMESNSTRKHRRRKAPLVLSYANAEHCEKRRFPA